jgi:predicted nucleic acid-binding protein
LRTFLDSGVLLAAWKRGEYHLRAISIMADDSRDFVTSDNVRLELVPKPTYEKRRAELEFYNEHFSQTSACEPFGDALGSAALTLAKKHGLSAGDALNVAAAIRLGAKEFVTSELPGKPLFRITEIRVVSLHSASIES